jgi:beta-glucosidase
MHAAGAAALRQVATRQGGEPMISIAHHERPFRPRPGSLGARLAAPLPGYVFNRWFLRCCRSGRLLPPAGTGRPLLGLGGSLDYIGVNYYTEERVRFDPGSPHRLFVSPEPDPDLPRNSLGWSIDPAGLRRALVNLWQEFRLPLFVTENGVADDGDELRPAYLIDHLRAVLEAVAQGVDVRGYLMWSDFDNFEWLEGYSAHFGLVAVDRATLERRPKPSAALFSEICVRRAVP